MKLLIAVLATPLAIALSFTSVKGAGVNLSWDDCGTHGAALRTFACDTNQGSHTLVGSFVAPAGVDAMSGNEFAMDVLSADSSLPDWWGMRTGLCRSGSLTWKFGSGAAPFSCNDHWQGASLIGSMAMDPPAGNRARITGLFSLPHGDAGIAGVPEGLEVFSFKTIIRNLKTAGLGACGGCASPACIVLDHITILQPPPLSDVQVAVPDYRQWVSWQCGASTGGGTSCGFSGCPTPTRSRTWGTIKQLYH